jgi:phage-related minor tail protein
MTNKTVYTVELQDNGSIKAKTADAKQFNNEMGKSAGISKAVKASYQGYDQARASGGTGAAGRDFAKQSEGLGGLVRVYATFAANIFAVSAAFTALSNAADTTNMVKGLDQLGATSGTALGTLAKQFTAASGGAISLREAMEATTKATSSGMSAKQLLQLGEVAKKASQALGVDMSDAVSRLTRGITKLEPELLDELGIFTKVGKSTEDYARSIGKSVGALTDLEKRQAFTNAVLAEGIGKFKDIEIDVNPYTKLLASLKDIATSGLTLVNTVIGPLIKLLGTSPTLLAAALSTISIMLLKQAIPAIGQYGSSLKESAEEAKKFAEARATSAKQALKVATDISAKEILAEKEKIADIRTMKVDAAEADLRATSKKGISKGVKTILAKESIQDITTKDIALLDKLGSKQTAVAGTYRELSKSITLAKNANTEYAKTLDILEKKRDAPPGKFTPAGIAIARAESARKTAASRSILSSVSENVGIDGFSVALKKMNESVKAEKLTGLSAGFVRVAGTAAAAASSIGGILSVASGLMGYIGMAVAVFGALSAVFSKNGAELESFQKSIELVESSTKTATDVAKKYEDTLTVSSILAKANAITTLTENLESLTSNLEKADISASFFDRLLDTAYKFVDKDLQSLYAKNTAMALSSSIEGITDPALKKQAQDSLKELLNIGDTSFQNIQKAFNSLDSSKVVSTGKAATKQLSEVEKASTKLAAPLREFNAGLAKLNDSYTALSNTLINNDPLSKFGADLAIESIKLADIFKNPILSVAALNELLLDTSKIKMFSPEAQAAILTTGSQLAGVYKQVEDTKQELINAEKKVIDTSKALDSLGTSKETKQVLINIKLQAEGQVAAAATKLEGANSRLNTLQQNMSSAMGSSLVSAFKLIESPLTLAIAKGSIEIQKTLINSLPKTAATAAYSAKLDQQSTGLQVKQLKSTDTLINTLDAFRLSNERLALEKKKDELPVPDIKARDAIDIQIKRIAEQEKAVGSKNLAKDLKSGDIASNPETIALLQRNIDLQTKLQELNTVAERDRITGLTNIISAGFDTFKEGMQSYLESLKTERASLVESPAFKSLSDVEQQKTLTQMTGKEQAAQKVLTLIPYQKAEGIAATVQKEAKVPELKSLASTALKDAQIQTKLAEANLDLTNDTTNAITRRTDAEIISNRLLDIQLKGLDNQNALSKEYYEQGSALIEQARARLDIQLNLGQINQDSYTSEIRSLDTIVRKREVANGVSELDIKYQKESLTLKNAIKIADGDAKLAKQQELLDLDTRYKFEKTGIADLGAAKEKTAQIDIKLSQRWEAFNSSFESSVGSMSDALIDFAMTGKQSFGDMITDMLLGIAKLELRMQLTESLKGARGLSGLMSSLTGGSQYTPGTDNFVGPMPQAKGGAWDSGIQKFAKGGSFTNSIVNSPTLFKFAKGTGLMGEAGAEAIMPLKRDAQGNLGVRGGASGGNEVSVVVNNFSTSTATTKETKDSRGNRRIEVTVGDMVAGEINRVGSGVQQSLKGTFGTQPQLIRR